MVVACRACWMSEGEGAPLVRFRCVQRKDKSTKIQKYPKWSLLEILAGPIKSACRRDLLVGRGSTCLIHIVLNTKKVEPIFQKTQVEHKHRVDLSTFSISSRYYDSYDWYVFEKSVRGLYLQKFSHSILPLHIDVYCHAD